MPDVDPAIAHLDWAVCECQTQSCGGQCANEATVRAVFHALDNCVGPDPELDADGNRTLRLCQPCFDTLRQILSGYVLRLGAFGRPMCTGCGAPVRCVRDVLRQTSTIQ